MPSRLKRWARTIKRDIHAIWLAARDPRTPWHVRALAFGIAAYAVSPIDLIPDFIPILGYLDDVILLPLGIMLVVRLMPAGLMAEHRAAAMRLESRPVSRKAAVVIVGVWVIALAVAVAAFWPDAIG